MPRLSPALIVCGLCLASAPQARAWQKGHASAPAHHAAPAHVQQQQHVEMPYFQMEQYYVPPVQHKQTHAQQANVKQANTQQANVKKPVHNATTAHGQSQANAMTASQSNKVFNSAAGTASYNPQNSVSFNKPALTFPSEAYSISPQGLNFPSEAFNFAPPALGFPSQASAIRGQFNSGQSGVGVGIGSSLGNGANTWGNQSINTPNAATALLGASTSGGAYATGHSGSNGHHYSQASYYGGRTNYGYGYNSNQLSPTQRHFNKLVHDLDSLSPNYAIAESHRITIKNDLMGLTSGYSRPSPSVVSNLSHTLANAMIRRGSQQINTFSLANDLQVVMNSGHHPRYEVDQAILQAQNVLSQGGFHNADIQTVVASMQTVAAQGRASLAILR